MNNVYIKYFSIFVAVVFLITAVTGILNENVVADPPTVNVQLCKWTSTDGTAISNETWLQSTLDDFEDDIDAAYNSSLNKSVVLENLLDVYEDYGIVPPNKDMDDLSRFFSDQYDENNETIEDFLEENGFDAQGDYYDVHISGLFRAPFYCKKIPIICYYFHDMGAYLTLRWAAGDGDNWGDEYENDYEIDWILFLGITFPPGFNSGTNYVGRHFRGWTRNLQFSFYD